MSDMRSLPCRPETDVLTVAQATAQYLTGQGYAAVVQTLNESSVILTVSKDRDGFKNFMGMGVECRATITKASSALSVSIDSEWTNKIIACAIGWVLCLIPLITGVIGCINQSELPGKIFTAITANIA